MGNFAEDIARKILFGVSWRKGGCTIGNCKGEKFYEIGDF